MRKTLGFLLLLLFSYVITMPFKQVVIWGHKLHSHTHSYIHDGFYKAFLHLGYPTLWLDNNDITSSIDFSNTLFLTEGQVDQNIPLRDDCFYILHNTTSSKYRDLIKNNKTLTIQVYTNDVPNRSVEKLAEYIYYDRNDRCLYIPWATDLLPHEIESFKSMLDTNKTRRIVTFIGTIGDGLFGNNPELEPFFKKARSYGLNVYTKVNLDPKKAQEILHRSLLAPAIQGRWQCDQGYVPCRIFKNISYGKLGITNNRTVYELFNKKIVFNENTEELFIDSLKRLQAISKEEIIELMDFVKDNHTYLNRVSTILDCIHTILEA